jgi:hypothetical protein
VGIPEGKRPAGRPQHRRDVNVRLKTGVYKYGVKVMIKPIGLVKQDTCWYMEKWRSDFCLKEEATIITYLLCLHTRST